MRRDVMISAAFLAASVFALGAAALAPTLAAQKPDRYVLTACGMFDGKLCKTVKTTSCIGSSCTEETSFYYYSVSIE